MNVVVLNNVVLPGRQSTLIMPTYSFNTGTNKFITTNGSATVKTHINNIISGSNNKFTLTFWVKIQTAQANSVFSCDNGTTLRQLIFNITATGAYSVVMFANPSNFTTYTSTSNVITDSNWHHVALTYDGTLAPLSRVVVYIDGVKKDNTGANTAGGVTSVFSTTAQDYQVGARSSASQYFAGYITDFAIFNTVISSTVASTLYSQIGMALTQANLSQFYHINGTTIYDVLLRDNVFTSSGNPPLTTVVP